MEQKSCWVFTCIDKIWVKQALKVPTCLMYSRTTHMMLLLQLVFGLVVCATACAWKSHPHEPNSNICASHASLRLSSLFLFWAWFCVLCLTYCSALMSLVCVCVSVCSASGWNIKGVSWSYQPLFNISHYRVCLCAYFTCSASVI